MSVQNRPWHFGSDGSSPLDRVRRVGYTGKLVGELISETYQTEIETLSDWMEQPDTRAIIMDPKANQMGFSWYQEPNGKIWWTMITGASTASARYWRACRSSNRGPRPSSGQDQDRRSGFDHRIDLLDLAVAHGDAACGPVVLVLAAIIGMAVDHDVAARLLAL